MGQAARRRSLGHDRRRLELRGTERCRRVVKDFRKENEKLKVKAGLLEGQVLNGKAVEEQLATMPGKDEVRAMLLATFRRRSAFVMLLNAPAQHFVGVLAAKQRKEGGG